MKTMDKETRKKIIEENLKISNNLEKISDEKFTARHNNAKKLIQNKIKKFTGGNGYMSLEELRKICSKYNINTQKQYQIAKKNKILPGTAHSDPAVYYPEWVSWPDLFGRQPKPNMLSLLELKNECKKLKIDTSTKYYNYSRNIPGAPSAPDTYYPEWVSWPDLFDKHWLSLTELKILCKNKYIFTQDQYLIAKKNKTLPSNAPNNPPAVYKIKWSELLEKQQQHTTYDIVRNYCIKNKIFSALKYFRLYNTNKLPKDFPSHRTLYKKKGNFKKFPGSWSTFINLDSIKNTAINMRKAGQSYDSISSKLKIPRTTIIRWIKSN